MSKSTPVVVRPRLENPPPVTGRGPKGGKWAKAVEQVKSKPGRWFNVADVEERRRQAVASVGYQLAKRVEGLEYAVRRVDGRLNLYLKYDAPAAARPSR